MRACASFGIYRDCHRRILPISIVFFAALNLVSAVTVFFTTWAYRELAAGGSAFYGNANTVFDFYSMSPLIITFASFGVPILVLISNSYMTRRADSDFYDSLPHTRVSVARSSMAAVLTVASVIIIFSFGISIACGYVFADSFVVPWWWGVKQLLSVLITSWISVAVFSISCAITGTTFNALTVGLLIAAGPRAIMAVINSAICETSPVLLADSVIPLFDNNYNVYTALCVGNYSVISSPAAYIYSIILAALYTLLAVFAVCKRKSESATHSAPSRLLQHVYRISVATLVSSLAFIIIFGYGFESTAVVIWVLAVIVYFAYELITTKRAKNLLGAFAAFPIFLLVNALLAGVIIVGNQTEANYTPDADEVDSVSVVLYGSDTYVSFDEYVTLMSDSVKITDKAIISLVTEALSENVEKYNGNSYGDYHSSRSDYVSAVFEIKAGLRTEQRSVYIKAEDYARITNKLAEEEEYRRLWDTLPENPELVSAMYSNLSFDTESARAIYDRARAEIYARGYDLWSTLYYSSDYEDAALSLYFDVTVGGESITVYLHVPRELTETYSVAESEISELMNEKKAKTEALLSQLRNDTDETLYLSVDVSFGNDFFSLYGSKTDFDSVGDTAELVDFISSMLTEEYADWGDENYINISIVSYGADRKSEYFSCKISSSVALEEIKTIFQKYGY